MTERPVPARPSGAERRLAARPALPLAYLLVAAAACSTIAPEPTPVPMVASATPVAAECPLPRTPSYLPWGTAGAVRIDRGPVSSLRSTNGSSYFVVERRADTSGAPISVTVPMSILSGRQTYLVWSGQPGTSELSAWWEEGSGDCHVYHARLRSDGDPAIIEAQFARIIAQIPPAFVDPSAGKTGLVAEIAVDHAPLAIAVMPFEARLYVVDRDGGLSAFTTSTNALVKRVVLPLTDRGLPTAMAVVPFTKRAYVTDFGGDRVIVVDGSTLDVVGTIPVGPFPVAIAAEVKADRIYVADQGRMSAPEEQGSIAVIDGRTDAVIATVPIHGHPTSVDISGDRVYAGTLVTGARESSFIQVIDRRTNTEVATVGVSPPTMLLGDPVDHMVYALSSFATKTLLGSIVIGSKWIELDTGTNEARTYGDGPADPRAIAWHPGSDLRYRRVYVVGRAPAGATLGFFRPNPGGRLGHYLDLYIGADPVGITVDGATHRIYAATDHVISVFLQGPG